MTVQRDGLRRYLTIDGAGKSTIAKTYRILHTVFATAVYDELIRRNPCRIKGAGQDKASERTRAALIYQHASRDRDEAIAAALNALIVEARKHAAA
jgi:hypothetical protein